jgi:hypothetical protein
MDLLKSLFVGAHYPMDEHEILDLERRTGIPINREELQKSQEQFSEIGKRAGEYIPTQEMAEKAIEKHAGVSLQPKTELGKFTHQASELAGLARGKGLAKAIGKGAAGAAATLALEKSGAASPEVSKMTGDVLSMVSRRKPKGFTASEEELRKVAEAHKLPFPELMTRVKEPFIRAEVSKATQEALKKEFNASGKEAIQKIVEREVPITRLQNKGINLEALQKNAHEEVTRAAEKHAARIDNEPILRAIDSQIKQLNTNPIPSESKKKAMSILREQRKALSPEAATSKPKGMTASQLVEQYRDNNENVRELYAKAQGTPVDTRVKSTYAFLNDTLMKQLEKVGGGELAEQMKAANKITQEVRKVSQVEKFLESAMHEGDFVPGKLEKKLASPRADKVKRILGEKGIADINDIAKYRSLAEKNVDKFLNLPGQAFRKEVADWGILAPILFFSPHAGVLSYAGRKGVARIQGRLLTRPATRRQYRQITKHAAAGQYDRLRKDFEDLNASVSQEFGSLENFVDDSMSSRED